ncbi:GNAT family N-acetyltransferase [Azospirillum sp. sgz302134]
MSGFVEQLRFPRGLSARLPRPEDEDFLRNLFITARPWLAMASTDQNFLRILYQQQIDATLAGLKASFPDFTDVVIERNGERVGRMIVALGEESWRLVEIAVVPELRGKGIGAKAFRALQEAVARAGVYLTGSVLMTEVRNLVLYQRLGCVFVAERPPVIEMEWRPPGRE